MTRPANNNELVRILGLSFGLAAVVGGCVGQGIMRTPGIVAGAAPGPFWIILLWTLGGLLALIDSFALMELGASIPRCGGPYLFFQRAFGPFAGTMMGWTDLLNNVVGVSFMTVVFAEYVHRLGLASLLPTGGLAVLLILLLAAINWTGTRTSGASQQVGTALKGLGLVGLALALFAWSGEPAPSAGGLPPALTLGGFAVAMRAINNTYGGWHAHVYFCEELKRPAECITRATVGGILLITLIYVGVNLALLTVLSQHAIAQSTLPMADAAAVVLGKASGPVVTVLAIVSVAAIANLLTMFNARIALAMARDGVLPQALTRVSVSGTPRIALFWTVAASYAFAATGSYNTLIAIAVPYSLLVYAGMDLAAIRLRRTEPFLERPFRMPLFPLPALIGLAMNAILFVAIVREDPLNSSLGLVLVGAIGALYWLNERLRQPIVS